MKISQLKKTLNKFWFIPLAPFIVVLIVVAVPLSLIVSLVSLPFDKRSMSKLKDEIKQHWLPGHRYLYLTYTRGTPFASVIEEQILPKYCKHLVVNVWDPEQSQHEIDEKDKRASQWISTLVIRDYDGAYEAVLVRVDHGLTISVAATTEEIEPGDTKNLDEAAQEFTGQIKECVATWTKPQETRHKSIAT